MKYLLEEFSLVIWSKNDSNYLYFATLISGNWRVEPEFFTELCDLYLKLDPHPPQAQQQNGQGSTTQSKRNSGWCFFRHFKNYFLKVLSWFLYNSNTFLILKYIPFPFSSDQKTINVWGWGFLKSTQQQWREQDQKSTIQAIFWKLIFSFIQDIVSP